MGNFRAVNTEGAVVVAVADLVAIGSGNLLIIIWVGMIGKTAIWFVVSRMIAGRKTVTIVATINKTATGIVIVMIVLMAVRMEIIIVTVTVTVGTIRETAIGTITVIESESVTATVMVEPGMMIATNDPIGMMTGTVVVVMISNVAMIMVEDIRMVELLRSLSHPDTVSMLMAAGQALLPPQSMEHHRCRRTCLRKEMPMGMLMECLLHQSMAMLMELLCRWP